MKILIVIIVPYANNLQAFICLDLSSCYQISMYDSWGDGWQGGYVAIGENNFTLESGCFGLDFFGGCGVTGCTDSEACNFDSSATIDDGSCLFVGESCVILGCTDVSACNFNEFAEIDNGSCTYLDGLCDSCVNGLGS